MDISSACPLRVGSILWQPRHGAFMLTVICKATFVLLPGECRLARDQDPPNESDDHWNDDERRSLHAASDLVPFKRRADVFLVGHAYAPGMKPVSCLTARLIVGELDKAIEVRADRVWSQYGDLREGSPFVKMPLRYERAAGGPETSNPVGMRSDAQPDMYGQVPVPNLQPPGFHVARQGEAIPPVGLGPIAPRWPERLAKLFRHAAAWDHRRWSDRPLPEDIDAAFFNAAPHDQQVLEIRSDERIVLQNLHAEHARLVTSLPGISPRAAVIRAGMPGQDLRLRCDTLAIDTDRGVCNLVWRGQVPLARPDEAGRVTVTMEGTEGNDAVATIIGGMRAGAALPFAGAEPAPAEEDEARMTLPIAMPAAAATLPFQEKSSPWVQPAIAAPSASPRARSEDDGTGTILGAMRVGEALPFAGAAPVPPAAPVAAPPPIPMVSPRFVPAEPAPQRYVEPEAAAIAPPAPAMIGPMAGVSSSVGDQPLGDAAAVPTPDAAVALEAALPELISSADEPAPQEVELSIEQWAVISAEITEGKAPRSEVLRKHDVSDRAWAANEHRWTKAIDEEASEGSSRVRSASDRAYVEAVEGFRGAITVGEYAQIVIGLERGRANLVLDTLGIQRPALMRIVRVWTKKVAGDARLADEANAFLASARGS